MENLDLGINLGFSNDNSTKDLLRLVDRLEKIITTMNVDSENINIFSSLLESAGQYKTQLQEIRKLQKDLSSDIKGKSKSSDTSTLDKYGKKDVFKEEINDLGKKVGNLANATKLMANGYGLDGRKKQDVKQQNQTIPQDFFKTMWKEYINKEMKRELRGNGSDYRANKNINVDKLRNISPEQYSSIVEAKLVKNISKGALERLSDSNLEKLFNSSIQKNIKELSKQTGDTKEFKEALNQFKSSVYNATGSSYYFNNNRTKRAIDEGEKFNISKEYNDLRRQYGIKDLKDMDLSKTRKELNNELDSLYKNIKLFNQNVKQDFIKNPNLKAQFDKSNGLKNMEFNERVEFQKQYNKKIAEELYRKENNINVLDNFRQNLGTMYFAKEVGEFVYNRLGMRSAKEFERNMASMGVSGGFTNIASINAEKNSILSASSIGINATEFAGNVREVIKTGRDYTQSMDLVNTASKLSITAFENLSTSVEILNGKFLAFNLDVSKDRIDRFTNRLYNALDNTALDLEDIKNAGKQSNTVINALITSAEESGGLKNKSIEQFIEEMAYMEMAMIGNLRQQGKTGEQAGVIFRNLFTKLMQIDGKGGALLDRDLRTASPQLKSRIGFGTSEELVDLVRSGQVEKVINGLSLLQKQGDLSFLTLKKLFTERHSSSVSSLLTQINGDMDKFIDKITTGKDLTEKQSLAMDNWSNILDRISNHLSNISKSTFTTGSFQYGIGTIGATLERALGGINSVMTNSNPLISGIATAIPQATILRGAYSSIAEGSRSMAMFRLRRGYDLASQGVTDPDILKRLNEGFLTDRNNVMLSSGFKGFSQNAYLATRSTTSFANSLYETAKSGKQVETALSDVGDGLKGFGSSVGALIKANLPLLSIVVGVNLLIKALESYQKFQHQKKEGSGIIDNLKETEQQIETLQMNIGNIFKTTNDTVNLTSDRYSSIIDKYLHKNQELMQSLKDIRETNSSTFKSLNDIYSEQLNAKFTEEEKKAGTKYSDSGLFSSSVYLALSENYRDSRYTGSRFSNKGIETERLRGYQAERYGGFTYQQDLKMFTEAMKETKALRTSLGKSNKGKFNSEITRDYVEQLASSGVIDKMFGVNLDKNKNYSFGQVIEELMMNNVSEEELVKKFTAGSHMSNDMKLELIKNIETVYTTYKEANELYLKQLEQFKQNLDNIKNQLKDYNQEVADIISKTQLPEIITKDVFKQKYKVDDKGNQVYVDSQGKQIDINKLTDEQFERGLNRGSIKMATETLSERELKKYNDLFKQSVANIDVSMWERNTEGVNQYTANLKGILEQRASLEKQEQDTLIEIDRFKKEGNATELKTAQLKLKTIQDSTKLTYDLEKENKHILDLSVFNFKTMQEIAEQQADYSMKMSEYSTAVSRAFGKSYGTMKNNLQSMRARQQLFNEFGSKDLNLQIANAQADKGSLSALSSVTGKTNFRDVNMSDSKAIYDKIMYMSNNNLGTLDGVSLDQYKETLGKINSIISENLKVEQQKLDLALQEKNLQIDIAKFWLEQNKEQLTYVKGGDLLLAEMRESSSSAFRRARGQSDEYFTKDLFENMDIKLEKNYLQLNSQIEYTKKSIEVARVNAQRQLEAMRKLQGQTRENTSRIVTEIPNKVDSSLRSAISSLADTVTTIANSQSMAHHSGGSDLEYSTGLNNAGWRTLTTWGEIGNKTREQANRQVTNMKGDYRSYGIYGLTKETQSLQAFNKRYNLNIQNERDWNNFVTKVGVEQAERMQHNFMRNDRAKLFLGMSVNEFMNSKFNTKNMTSEQKSRLSEIIIDKYTQYGGGGSIGRMKRGNYKNITSFEDLMRAIREADRNNIEGDFKRYFSGGGSRKGILNRIDKGYTYGMTGKIGGVNTTSGRTKYQSTGNIQKDIDNIQKYEDENGIRIQDNTKKFISKMISDYNNLYKKNPNASAKDLIALFQESYKGQIEGLKDSDIDVAKVKDTFDNIQEKAIESFNVGLETVSEMMSRVSEMVKSIDINFRSVGAEASIISRNYSNMLDGYTKFNSGISKFTDVVDNFFTNRAKATDIRDTLNLRAMLDSNIGNYIVREFGEELFSEPTGKDSETKKFDVKNLSQEDRKKIIDKYMKTRSYQDMISDMVKSRNKLMQEYITQIVGMDSELGVSLLGSMDSEEAQKNLELLARSITGDSTLDSDGNITETLKKSDFYTKLKEKGIDLDTVIADLKTNEDITNKITEIMNLEINALSSFIDMTRNISDSLNDIEKSLAPLDNSRTRNIREMMVNTQLLNKGISPSSATGQRELARIRAINSREQLSESSMYLNRALHRDPQIRTMFKQNGYTDEQINNMGFNINNPNTLFRLGSEYDSIRTRNYLNAQKEYEELVRNNPLLTKFANVDLRDRNQLEILKKQVEDSGVNSNELDSLMKLIQKIENDNIIADGFGEMLERNFKNLADTFEQSTNAFSKLYSQAVDVLSDGLFGTEGTYKPLDYKASLQGLFDTLGSTGIFNSIGSMFGGGNKGLDVSESYTDGSGKEVPRTKTASSINLGANEITSLLLNASVVYDGILKKELNYKLQGLKLQEQILQMNLQMAETSEERRRIEEQILQNKIQQIDMEYQNNSSFMGVSQGTSGFAMQGLVGGLQQGVGIGSALGGTFGAGIGALVGGGLGLIGGIFSGTSAKIQAEQQKAMAIAQQKLVWLQEDSNRYLKTMANTMSEQAKWTTKIGVNDAISRSVRSAIQGSDTLGGTAYETITHQNKKKKGGGLLGSKKYDTVETVTASYNLNDPMFGGKQFENKQDLEFAYGILSRNLLSQALGTSSSSVVGRGGSRLHNLYLGNKQIVPNKYYMNTSQASVIQSTQLDSLNAYLNNRIAQSGVELNAGQFIRYFNGQGSLAGDGMLIDRSRDNEIDSIINNLTNSLSGMSTQQRVNTKALIDFYNNIKAVLDKEGKTTKRLFGNYYGIDTEEIKDEKGNITEYRRVNESMWTDLYQQVFQNVMQGTSQYNIGSNFITGTVNAFIQNVSSGRASVKAITEEFNKLADQIYDVVTRTGEFENVTGTIQSLINNMALLKQQQKETEQFTIDLAKRWVALGGNITDVIKDMNNGLSLTMDSIKTTLLGESLENTINTMGSNLFQKLSESMTENLINSKYANSIFDMNTLLTNATSTNSIADIVALANGYKGLSVAEESDRERLSAIQRLFTANRDIDYVDESIKYETGTSQSITNNYTFQSDINAGTVIADQLSIEQFGNTLLPVIYQGLKDLGVVK